MRCFGDKKLHKVRFFGAISRSFVEGARRLQESVPRDPTSPYKISSQSVPICPNYSRKGISYDFLHYAFVSFIDITG